jgi:hypothetical protein
MASDAQETLYSIFAALSGGMAGSVGGGLVGSITGGSSSATASKPAQVSGGSTAETIAMDVLKSGFGMVPLVSTLFGLFGSGDPAPAPLAKYAMPAPVSFQAAETATGFASVDYGQNGTPRAYDQRPSGSAAQVNVTVQAMDARSFLDRSSDIAAAVRDAMLNLNSINDVVNDL